MILGAVKHNQFQKKKSVSYHKFLMQLVTYFLSFVQMVLKVSGHDDTFNSIP